MKKKKDRIVTQGKPEIDERVLEFGRRIKEVRKLLKLKQREFGARIGMANNYLSEIETGKVKSGFDFFYKVSEAFNIDLLYLLHGKEPVFIDNDKAPVMNIPTDLESFLKGEDEKLAELIRYMKHFDSVYHGVMEFFVRYKLNNRDVIEKERQEKGEKVRRKNEKNK